MCLAKKNRGKCVETLRFWSFDVNYREVAHWRRKPVILLPAKIKHKHSNFEAIPRKTYYIKINVYIYLCKISSRCLHGHVVNLWSFFFLTCNHSSNNEVINRWRRWVSLIFEVFKIVNLLIKWISCWLKSA